MRTREKTPCCPRHLRNRHLPPITEWNDCEKGWISTLIQSTQHQHFDRREAARLGQTKGETTITGKELGTGALHFAGAPQRQGKPTANSKRSKCFSPADAVNETVRFKSSATQSVLLANQIPENIEGRLAVLVEVIEGKPPAAARVANAEAIPSRLRIHFAGEMVDVERPKLPAHVHNAQVDTRMGKTLESNTARRRSFWDRMRH
jgi:hypothetical protein